MYKFLQVLFPRELARCQSKVNGEIRVVEQFGKRTILVGGLQQSGDLVEMIWRKGIEKVTSYELKVTSVLILGLGGGSAAKVVNHHFPNAQISGVEIDPKMVNIGKKFMHLSSVKHLTICIADANKFVKKAKKRSFDLVLVDLYIGKSTPAFLESNVFLQSIKNILLPNGLVIFNRLRGKATEQVLVNFKCKLENVFDSVLIIKPLVNSLFIVSNQPLEFNGLNH